jgi:hypothetical protein
VACPRCAGAVLIERNDPEFALVDEIDAVPRTRRETDIRFVPPRIDNYYQQALRALDADLPESAVVALRRTLEAACKHFLNEDERRGKELYQQLELLIDRQIMPGEFREALRKIRQRGNAGAHVVESHSLEVRVGREDARNTIRFAAQVLRILFEIPEELSRL